MSPRSLQAVKAAIAVATAAAFALTAAPAHAAPAPDPSAWTELSTTYQATAKYGYEASAAGGGYVRTDECVADPAEGGMGYHYVNPANIGSLDPEKPAALLYAEGSKNAYADIADFGSGRKLVAVEWVVKDEGQAAPTLFGQTFQKDQLPGHFTLHAWIYKPNSKGLFASWNPLVVCPTV
ncbi:hypothetical protein [Streptomyces pseudovenezuelae]|uniref:Chitin-binding type-4 domain-containing protein n=1 Tax=Streptomyces pseudovenezuelae TaxID=67350 RepID=A0ABT6LN05_9ACTN|nr:hypothetical protein [Streptomyces pseudovenezuelae]MDH6217695.1 hypothetical protein [Streptomyces pseudovenezuelae]